MLVDTTFIYALTEPGTRVIRYIGKSDTPKHVLRRHLYNARIGKKYHAARWLRKLLKTGQRPDVHVLCEVPGNDWERFECAFITLGNQCGLALTNTAPGGEGTGSGDKHPHWGRTGEKHPLFGKPGTMLGKKHEPETKQIMRALKLGKKLTSTHCANISAANRLKEKSSPETCARRRNKKLGARSAFYGVGWDSRRGEWRVRIHVNDRSRELGFFSDEVEAAEVYDIAAKIYHGAHAVLNFPD